jgi:hypothetical protein
MKPESSFLCSQEPTALYPILCHPRPSNRLFLFLGCEAIGTAATPGLLCQPRVIVKTIVEKLMECRLAGETEVFGENLPQRHFCPSQNPTWPDPGLNPGRRGGKPATNRLSYGAVPTDFFRNRFRLLFSLKGKQQAYMIAILCVYIYVPQFIFCTTWPIFTKLGMKFVPLKANLLSSSFNTVNNNDMANAWTCAICRITYIGLQLQTLQRCTIFVKIIFCTMCNSNMAAVLKISLVFVLMTITDEPLELNMWNLVWR